VDLESAKQVLRKYWRYNEFRPGQETAIEAVLAGRDTLTIMPTGGGKSLCYQVPAMLLPGVTLVVSPLISLMKDQVDTLDDIGLPATYINSTLSGAEMTARLNAVERGDVKLVYVAPERFDSESFQERVSRLRVSLLAVDEAHCVSQWGHDFRPSYLRVGRVRAALGNPPIAALTATATQEVRRDVVRQLELRDPEVLVTGFDRRNLSWHVLRAKNDSEKDRLLLKLLRSREGSAIVYASTRKSVDALMPLLNGVGISAVGYHAGLGDAERKRIQEEFMAGDARVAVATNAFGMGIDKPDVRTVVHYNMPGTLEAYYQEAGRAGRDGGPADCVLLHAYADRFTHEFFIDQSYPPRKIVEEVMRALRTRSDAMGFFSTPVAELARSIASVKSDRQVYAALRVLEEHGLVRQIAPGGAQAVRVRLIATPSRISRDLGETGRTAELTLLRNLWKRAGGETIYQGIDLDWRELNGLAKGSRASDLLDTLQREGFVEWEARTAADGLQVLDRSSRIQQLPIDWRAAENRKERETSKLQKMQGYAYNERCRRGYLLRYFGDSAAMSQCGACDNCLQNEPLASAAAPSAATRAGGAETRRGPANSRSAASPAVGAVEELTPDQRGLYETLRRVRREVADRAGLPPYFLFAEGVLQLLARRCPTTPEALLDVPGVGSKSLDKYGLPFLNALRAHAGEEPLDSLPAAVVVQRPRAGSLSTAEGPASHEEAELYAGLRELRSRLAREAGLPAYCVFPDRTLVELARRRPASDAELLTVPGVGPAKLEKYGEAFLELLRSDSGGT
jgi:ATP-dependent DNA helicase RecQ